MASWKKLVQQNKVAMVTGSFSGSAHISGSLYGKATTVIDDGINSDQIHAGAIDTAHIADNQITLAKMAGLDRGHIIYGDASNNPASLANSTTDGHVLTVQNANGDIAWEAASGGGGDVDVSGTPSNDQLAIWTDADTLEGNSNLTFNTNTDDGLVTTRISASLGISASCGSSSSLGDLKLCGALSLGAGGIIRDYGGNTGITVTNGSTGLISCDASRAVAIGGGYGSTGTTITATGIISTNSNILVGAGYQADLPADGTGTTIYAANGLATNAPLTASNAAIGIVLANAHITGDGEIVVRTRASEDEVKTKETKGADGTVNIDEITKEDGSVHTVDVKRGDLVHVSHGSTKIKTGGSDTIRFEVASDGVIKLGDVDAILPLSEIGTRKETRTVYATDGGVF